MDLLLLYGLGIGGWLLFAKLRLPLPAMMGPILLVGLLRGLGLELPFVPPGSAPIVQILLGFYMGNLMSIDALAEMRKMALPVALVMLWALMLAFVAGSFLSLVTPIDLLTAILSSSTGGMPEMTVIALDTNADASTVIIMQLVRVVAVIIAFPMILRSLRPKPRANDPGPKTAAASESKVSWEAINMKKLAVSLIMAIVGGSLFLRFNIPAGGMVGSMALVMMASAYGYGVRVPTPHILNILLVAVGLMVADTITPEVIRTVVSGRLAVPILLSTTLTIASSLLLAHILVRITQWDYTTCFMAAAPGGLTVMTALALQYKTNPAPVFVLHMCRILILKTAIPFALVVFL